MSSRHILNTVVNKIQDKRVVGRFGLEKGDFLVKSGDLDCFGERGDLLPNQEISHSDRESRHVCDRVLCFTSVHCVM